MSGLIKRTVVCALVLGIFALSARVANAEPGEIGGVIPPAGGIAAIIWGGGPVEQLRNAALSLGCDARSVWTFEDGRSIGYVGGAPRYVNAQFLETFTEGEIPAGAILILTCAAPSTEQFLVVFERRGVPEPVPGSSIDLVPYVFRVTGFDLRTLSYDELRTAWTRPRSGWGCCGPTDQELTAYLSPFDRSGRYRVALTLPDTRRTETFFEHIQEPFPLVEVPDVGLPVANYEVDDNVPNEQVHLITSGIQMAATYLRDMLGADIMAADRGMSRVKIVASGFGNQEQGAGGSSATALSAGSPRARLFFDVKHPQWMSQQLDVDRQKIAAHEYAHGWQNSLGCLSFNHQPLPGWFNEGVAEYVAYSAAVRAGVMNHDDVMQFMAELAVATGEAAVPLESLEYPGESYSLWPGNIGFFAVHQLVDRSPSGVPSLRIVCEDVAFGATVDEAFEDAFGLTRQQFYKDFESFRLDLLAS